VPAALQEQPHGARVVVLHRAQRVDELGLEGPGEVHQDAGRELVGERVDVLEVQVDAGPDSGLELVERVGDGAHVAGPQLLERHLLENAARGEVPPQERLRGLSKERAEGIR
jgi:hypothetical protein